MLAEQVAKDPSYLVEMARFTVVQAELMSLKEKVLEWRQLELFTPSLDPLLAALYLLGHSAEECADPFSHAPSWPVIKEARLALCRIALHCIALNWIALDWMCP